eukprot:3482922-Pleurochrysis_carterae.AAC.1
MVSDPWFWPVLAEIYERAEPILGPETERYLAQGATLDPELTVMELSRRFAELIDGDGGITHKQKHTVRDSSDEPEALLCYTRRGELGVPLTTLAASRNQARIKRCI